MCGNQGPGAKQAPSLKQKMASRSFAQRRIADLGTGALTLHVTGLPKLSPWGAMSEHARLQCLWSSLARTNSDIN